MRVAGAGKSEVVFHKGRMLGKGGFGKVYEVVEQHTGCVYACKVIARSVLSKSMHMRKRFMQEIEIHSAVSNAAVIAMSGDDGGVVQFERAFTDDDQAYLMMELCEHGTLSDMVKQRGRIPEPEARFWITQLVSAIRLIHSQLVIHRDLKLGNLFIQHGMHLRVGDFGLAARLTDPGDRLWRLCGTPNYIAPEVLSQAREGYSFQADVWSIGVIIYTLLIGYPPFEMKDVWHTYGRIKRAEYTFPEDRPVSGEARALIGRILRSNPADRLSLDQIVAHPWFAMPVPRVLPICALWMDPCCCSPREVLAADSDCSSSDGQPAKKRKKRITDPEMPADEEEGDD